MKLAKWNPFRLRNLALGALALGIIAGLWLGDRFKGLGGGISFGVGMSDAKSNVSKSRVDFVDFKKSQEQQGKVTSSLVRILIDDRKYYLRENDGDRPIDLESLVERVKSTTPNDDGLRAVVDCTAESRPSAELKLQEAFKAGGIPKKAVYWVE